MATNLLTPTAAAPNGVPPKNILAFIALGVLVLIGVGAMYLDSSKSTTAEGEAKKATLQEAAAGKDVGVKGDPKDVAKAADKAGVPASLRSENPTGAASAPKVADLPTAPGVSPANGKAVVLPAPYPLPPGVGAGGGTAAAVASQGSQANLDAIRDTEISNAKPLVADFGAPGAVDTAAKSSNDPIERLIQSQRSDTAQRTQAITKAADPSQYAGLMGGGGQQSKSPATARDSDKAFLAEFSNAQRERGIRPSLPEAPLMLAQGSSIEAVILREVNSDLPGVITARTTRDIYDSTTVSRMVIPRGSTVVGAYSSDVRLGQSRLLFAFSRLVLPDGQSFDLNGFGGGDAQGRSGLQADVDNHYFRLFGTSLLIGLLADSAVRRDVVPQGGLGGGGGLTATGQILTDTARSILERNREANPTLKIQAGTRVLIEVRRDMIFPTAYRD